MTEQPIKIKARNGKRYRNLGGSKNPRRRIVWLGSTVHGLRNVTPSPLDLESCGAVEVELHRMDIRPDLD